MKIRELDESHTDEIKSVFLKIFSEEPWNDAWTDRQLQLYILELMGNSNPLLLGLYDNERLAGISLGRIRHWYTGVEYWIDEFGVLPEYQQKGTGSDFMKKIKEFLADRDVKVITLLTDRTFPAFRFYKKNGFSEREEQVFMVYRSDKNVYGTSEELPQ